MIAKILAATLIQVVLAEGPFGPQGRFFGGFRGPLTDAAATLGISSVEPVYPPQPYSFGYDNADEYGTQSYHKEQGDANNVKTGTYGYRDANGIYRRVSYVADANGFRATVDTNEPGTAPGSSAGVVFNEKPISVPVAAKSASAPLPAYAVAGAFVRAPWSG
ncbi:cuticle protein 10.9-like [Rhipicephalus microplus]|uniref:cuticle protein 10.9-like n=1 Tax=Rhipicephalus microplus TaxID=6941 RepID=UPI002376666A